MDGLAFCIVDNLKIKIEHYLQHSDNSLNSQSREILNLIYKHLDSFEEIAKTTLDTDLDYSIDCEASHLECIIDKIVSKSERNKDDDDDDDDDDNNQEEDEDADEEEDGVGFSMENLKQRIDSFTQRLKMEVQSCSDGLYNWVPEEEEEEEEKDSTFDVSSKVIGVSDVYQQLKDKLMSSPVTSLVGMPGIGKTIVANKLFHDPTVVECFDHRVWVRVGKNCRVKDIPRRILAEMDPDGLQTLPEEEVHQYLKASLKRKSCLIVLDDVWDRFAMYLLHPLYRYKWNELDHPFLHTESASRVLITSRLQQLDHDRDRLRDVVSMRLLNKEESWGLLCDKVFCKGSSCPPQLEKAGRKISKNCDGLPLTIVTVARLLSKEETCTPEYWNAVAARKNHQIFMNAYDEISKVLLPSYTYLPRLLRMCFLFIGLFPRNHEIRRTKLINLWMADGFFELNISIGSVEDAIDCLEELVSNSVVMVYKECTFNSIYSVKTCGLHVSFLHLSRQIANQTKFALVLSSPNDCLGDGVEGHHRLSFNNNVLFGTKSVNKFVEDNFAFVARSLMCFGPYHRYQVPLCFRLKLLTELDAISIRFYEFPIEVLQLVRLRYLALTSNGIIPPSISHLSSLQFLIVDQHQNINFGRDQSYLPVEIWGLQNLKHLQVMGSDLPDPCGAYLDSLDTLLNVSVRSCTEAVFNGLPLLKELKIRIELAPDDDGKTLRCFSTHIPCLRLLSVLKCIIVNPDIGRLSFPVLSFPPLYLTSLSLSGLGYPWKEMRKIASLPRLRVLKLKNYAFRGPEWIVEENGFANLTSLVVEDTDMVDLKFECGAFKVLTSLTIRCCFKLEKIRGEFGTLLQMIELVDCNPSCVDEMKKATPKKGLPCVLDVQSSWNDGKLKTTRHQLR